jgi:hypothetical protein
LPPFGPSDLNLVRSDPSTPATGRRSRSEPTPRRRLFPATPTSTAASAMEVVPAAETHVGQEWFDLGVFVGDLVLDEEVTRYGGTQACLLCRLYVVIQKKLTCRLVCLSATTSRWRGCGRSSTTARMTRCYLLLQQHL